MEAVTLLSAKRALKRNGGARRPLLATRGADDAWHFVLRLVRTDSLDFKNQRKVVRLRGRGQTWESIAKKVVNLKILLYL